jgi:DNA-binding MarR family transcriptional regulator
VARFNPLSGHHSLEKGRTDGVVQGQRGQATAAAELDRLIHERMRLGIVSALAANESLSFSDLKKLLATTDGNLSVHARKLEEAKYIVCEKYFEGRLPKTVFRLSPGGRHALERYLNQMEALIHSMRGR